MKKIYYFSIAVLLMAGCHGDKPLPEPEPNPNPEEDAVVTTFSLTLRHNMDYLRSPEWRGSDPQGSVDWGDGTTQSYSDGIDHYYDADGAHAARFDMADVEGFEIEQLGDIKHFDIAM